METNKPKIRALNGISKVVCSSLFFEYETRTYHLVHYDTEILTIRAEIQATNKDKYIITKCLKCSPSSTRAILQVTDFLQIPRKTVKESMIPYNKFHFYKTGETRKKKNELLEVINK